MLRRKIRNVLRRWAYPSIYPDMGMPSFRSLWARWILSGCPRYDQGWKTREEIERDA